MKNKLFLLTIVVIISLFFCVSCGKDRKYNEDEVIKAAEELIKKSEMLNDIYYGKGIDYIKDESTADGAYYEADYISLNRFGVENINDIKNMTYECFTKNLSSSMINTILTSVSDDDGIQRYSRYYQKYNALDNKEECIMVYKDAIVYLTDDVVYDYSSIRISRVEKEEVFVKISVSVTDKEKRTQTKEIEISLLEESDGWRINSPTYTKYVDREYYEDLQKNK